MRVIPGPMTIVTGMCVHHKMLTVYFYNINQFLHTAFTIDVSTLISLFQDVGSLHIWYIWQKNYTRRQENFAGIQISWFFAKPQFLLLV